MCIRGYCALILAFLAMRLAFCAPKCGKVSKIFLIYMRS